ncbi:hypothetical protein CDL12_19189 [Handroanthus impetiginosus]|uniref:Uncharacterized protein n=1 Tax=Handroanthus impetiginosus TaxID=429701 RepID=A0A2G9GSN8_9LAMI|nr:hypothetical protein CDL12_19189 [Handroanthus impetiginosus]
MECGDLVEGRSIFKKITYCSWMYQSLTEIPKGNAKSNWRTSDCILYKAYYSIIQSE